MKNPPHSLIDYSPEIQQALAEKRPIVALESTIIAHGMPYPQNLETAAKLESEVRKHEAIPATIAILNGRIKVGLNEAQLHLLATAKEVIKVSRRDLPIIMAQGKHAATTVAATMIFADMAGIRIFATGGIGGVHRGAQQTFDISADMQELAHTSVAVVSAGAKSILDLGLTLEYMETMGIPVIGYQTHDFPAFYSRRSGFLVPHRLDTPEAIAKSLSIKWQMGLMGGVLIANPIPQAYHIPSEQIEGVIDQAMKEASAQRVGGKELTPFLLARISALTAGSSLFSNIQLVLNNARLAAKIAVAYGTLLKGVLIKN